MKAFLPPEAKNAKEAIYCFATAFLFLLLGLALLVWNSPRLADGAFGDGKVIAGLHFITLGWLSLSIFGALQVFTGVALGSSLECSKSMIMTRAAWTVGVCLFPTGLFLENPVLILPGLFFLFLGIVLFSLRLLPALRAAKRGQLTRAYLSIALMSLWVAFILGSLAGLVRTGLLSVSLPPGNLSAHVLVAVFGWVGGVIIGVGSHLIPMFILAKPGSTLALKFALPCWLMIPVSSAVGAFYPNPWNFIGWGAAAIGSLFWCIQFAVYFKGQVRSGVDLGILMSVFATLFLLLAWVLLFIADVPYQFMALVLVGWLLLFTLGIYHRVIPFLVWFLRFSRTMALGSAPRVKDLLDARLSALCAVFAIVGIAVWIAGLVSNRVEFIYGGSASLLTAVGLCLLQIRVLTKPAPKGGIP